MHITEDNIILLGQAITADQDFTEEQEAWLAHICACPECYRKLGISLLIEEELRPERIRAVVAQRADGMEQRLLSEQTESEIEQAEEYGYAVEEEIDSEYGRMERTEEDT